jgi:alpha 1,3-glucosidase
VHSPAFSHGTYTARIANALYPNVSFSLNVDFVETGSNGDISTRIRIDEVDGLRQRYNEAASWALVKDPSIVAADERFAVKLAQDRSSISWGRATKNEELVVEHSPIRLTFFRDKQPHVVLNDRGLFNMEHFRAKTAEADAAAEDAPDQLVQDPDSSHDKGIVDAPVAGGHFIKFLDSNEDGMWQETFGGRTDSKPKGAPRGRLLYLAIVQIHAQVPSL